MKAGNGDSSHELKLMGFLTELYEKDINYFYTVQPDLMLFKENDWVVNDFETRYAGCPDLILEVWSEANDELYRNFKKNLYKTSNTTEHWYITQDSNLDR